MKLEVKSQKKIINFIFEKTWKEVLFSEINRKKCRAFIVFDKNSAAAYPEILNEFPSIILSDKQIQKTRQGLEAVQEKLFDVTFKKSDLLLGIGGGVVQDITALSAASYLGGIEWISVPTTFNSIVNPTFRGQLNTAWGKNTLSYFSLPSILVVDLGTTAQLTDQSLIVGLVEFLRIAVSYNAALFKRLERNWMDFFIRDEKLMLDFVKPLIGFMGKQYNSNTSRFFGYTIAEAIDWATRYSVPHGIALLFSMEIELKAGISARLISDSYYKRLKNILTVLLEKYPSPNIFKRKIRKMGIENIMIPLKYSVCGNDLIPLALPEKIGKLRSAPAYVPFSVIYDEVSKFFSKEEE